MIRVHNNSEPRNFLILQDTWTRDGSLRNSPKCNGPSSSCWPNYRPASTTVSRLTSTGRAGNTGQLVNVPESPATKSSAASCRLFRLPKAWASKATFANGKTCCGLAIDHLFAKDDTISINLETETRLRFTKKNGGRDAQKERWRVIENRSLQLADSRRGLKQPCSQKSHCFNPAVLPR
jgi:hypothetical protein